jgi:DNA polymerase-3 subunit delta'
MWQVIGQERAVSLLERSLTAGSLAHAYLFVGPEHAGKMTLALNLAQALNCNAAGERPCLECPACRKIAAGNHADVRVIGLLQNDDSAEAKLIKIEQIKDMQHSASLPPFEGRHKVFIINGAELLSTEAANSLLKTLEEPAPDVSFILLTTNDRLLPETVVSRCQRLEVTPLPVPVEAAALQEKWGVPAGRARLLAGLSHGCLGWAVIAGGDEDLLRQRDEQLDWLVEVIRGDYETRFAYVSRLAAGFTQKRSTVYAALDLWLDYWRDLMLARLGCYDAVTNVDRRDELAALAGQYRLGQIKEFIASIQAAAGQLRQNVNPRLALEVLMLDLPIPEGGGEDG